MTRHFHPELSCFPQHNRLQVHPGDVYAMKGISNTKQAIARASIK
ncbi:MAG: hypothetical protein ACRC62_33145 [Microcoleus sp.]